jgi:Domain of unknown function (DUF4837)
MTVMKRLSLITTLALLASGLTSCDSGRLVYGDHNSIIAAMTPELWDELSEDVYAALEPTIRTVRDEKTFTVTYQDPAGEQWGNLQRFRQMLLVGTASDPWVAEAIGRAKDPISEPGLHRIKNVWAAGQTVTLILLGPDQGAEAVRPHLPEINRTLDEEFRRFVVSRMYMSGVDSALADTLYVEAGFAILPPTVYTWSRTDSVYIFRNDQPDPGELIRQVAVTWMSPIPSDMQPEGILAWRERTVDEYYSEPQLAVLDNADAHPYEFRGNFAYEIQAEWTNPPELNWPAGGPFITRALVCEGQNRMYLLDAWLYAPKKEKYEYMIQIQTILDTFRCGQA